MSGRVELESLTDLVYSAAVRECGWPECIHSIRQALRADRIGVFRHDFRSATGNIECAEGIEPAFCTSYSAVYAGKNVWFRAGAKFSAGLVLKGAEVVPVWEVVGTDFYRGWMRPQNILQTLLAVITHDGATCRSLIAMRSGQAPPFGNYERALAASLVPHLRRALVLTALLREDRQRTNVLIELFNQAPQAILVVDRSCLIHLKNRAADELLARDNGLHRVGGRLYLTTPEEDHQLRELVAAKAGGIGTSERMLMTRPLPESCRLLLTVSPMHSRLVSGGEGAEIPLAAISARDRTRDDNLSVAQLRRLLPLTPAEAKLASLVLAGHGLLESAGVLHISKNTARTHMKRIYSKAAIHRQPELRRLLDSSVFEPNKLRHQDVLRHPWG